MVERERDGKKGEEGEGREGSLRLNRAENYLTPVLVSEQY